MGEEYYEEYSVPPSAYVRVFSNVINYVNITECTNCHRMAAYVDQHPANPCPRCGNKVAKKVGRWRGGKGFMWRRTGYWEVKE